MEQKDVTKSKKQFGFGSKRNFETAKSPVLSLTKKTTNVEKENKTSNVVTADKEESPLKGFLLYFAEKSDQVSQDENISDQDDLRGQCLKVNRSRKNFTIFLTDFYFDFRCGKDFRKRKRKATKRHGFLNGNEKKVLANREPQN